MNIKTLVLHVIDRAVDRIADKVEQHDDELITRLARKFSGAQIGEHVEVDYEDLAQALDHEEIARNIRAADIAEIVSEDISAEDVADHLDLSDIAYNLNYDSLAEYLDSSEVAANLDHNAVAEEMGDISREVAEHIDYAKLAKNLNPLEAVSASQKGAETEDPSERLQLNGLAGKLMDAAVDKLLVLANKKVEEDLAVQQKLEQEGQEQPINGQADGSFLGGPN